MSTNSIPYFFPKARKVRDFFKRDDLYKKKTAEVVRKWATEGKGDGVDRDSIDCHKEKYGMGGYKG